MASDEVPTNLNDISSVTDGTGGAQAGLDDKLAGLSLASRAVHADNGIQSHRAVAPAMHVSTTFRYNDDPDALRAWDNTDVSADLFLKPSWYIMLGLRPVINSQHHEFDLQTYHDTALEWFIYKII